MATKSLLLAALLLVVVSLAPRSAVADKQPPLALVAGVVPCSAGSSINVAAVPPFPNAVVHMVCGGRVVAGTKADERGAFTMNMGTVTSSLLAPLLGNQCKVVVVTPLAACNASLASVSGTLAAPVQLLSIDNGVPTTIDNVANDETFLVEGTVLAGFITADGILNVTPLTFSVV